MLNMQNKTIRLKIGDNNKSFKRTITGEQALSALGKLYEDVVESVESLSHRESYQSCAGYAAINMFLGLFGEEITKKVLFLCKTDSRKSEKLMKKLKRVIKRDLYPMALRTKRQSDRLGVARYL